MSPWQSVTDFVLKTYRSARLPYSGILAFDGAQMNYRSRRAEWRVEVHDIAVVGEFTTTADPVADDYFIVFVARNAMLYIAPYYAEGARDVIKTLGSHLNAPLQTALANSTEWRTRIMWPTQFLGQPLLELVGDFKLTPAILAFLGTQSPKAE